ncbi:FAD-dependent oxidoreductase, partial [Bacillus thuringiensis]|nr:FAD-dependent oxidoreductase [Bacillus thuringiensis]
TLGCYSSILTLENYLNRDTRVMLSTMPGKTVGIYSAGDNTEAKGMLLFQSEALEYDRYDEESQRKLVENDFVGHT